MEMNSLIEMWIYSYLAAFTCSYAVVNTGSLVIADLAATERKRALGSTRGLLLLLLLLHVDSVHGHGAARLLRRHCRRVQRRVRQGHVWLNRTHRLLMLWIMHITLVMQMMRAVMTIVLVRVRVKILEMTTIRARCISISIIIIIIIIIIITVFVVVIRVRVVMMQHRFASAHH